MGEARGGRPGEVVLEWWLREAARWNGREEAVRLRRHGREEVPSPPPAARVCRWPNLVVGIPDPPKAVVGRGTWMSSASFFFSFFSLHD